ncbi:hypothetical protein FA15DRAFT_711266 [Coprinopsis marcescibilis]|uniref:Uncharacterized protein n=1 Tax=Coprinopsis marcescibilis TaxID=230819 RepID=A0A5C3KAQ8_COPMA|nr:hypothetical protein FA15DRAFT_711266 [Coprinopsis marcescibilis]
MSGTMHSEVLAAALDEQQSRLSPQLYQASRTKPRPPPIELDMAIVSQRPLTPAHSRTPNETTRTAKPHIISGQLSEEFIQESFHHYLKSTIAQAKLEGLLTDDVVETMDRDFAVTGPALVLYFAAARSKTSPPSVPLPLANQSEGKKRINLSYDNCPPAFISFMKEWARNVPQIQRLSPEYQTDLSRVICGLEPLTQPINIGSNGIAANLRSVAIEISQRKSFQDRVNTSLNAALGSRRGQKPFVLPKFHHIPTSPRLPNRVSIASCMSSSSSRPSVPSWASSMEELEKRDRPFSPSSSSSSASSSSFYLSPATTPNTSTSSLSDSPSTTTPTPTLLTPDTPAIEFIRETLYASLADQLERVPSLGKLLAVDPTRAYYGAIAFALLDVATTAVTREGDVEGVLGMRLTLDKCPANLQPLMKELVSIGKQARVYDDEDDDEAIQRIGRGKKAKISTMERVRGILEFGVGVAREGRPGDGPRGIEEGKAVEFANRLNLLALKLTSLEKFRERQEYVFKVLSGVSSP